jgi:hypothetical protein
MLLIIVVSLTSTVVLLFSFYRRKDIAIGVLKKSHTMAALSLQKLFLFNDHK